MAIMNIWNIALIMKEIILVIIIILKMISPFIGILLNKVIPHVTVLQLSHCFKYKRNSNH